MSERFYWVNVDGQVYQCGIVTDDLEEVLSGLAETLPNAIFFRVTETTDIWEKEWDFNDYAHTFPKFE